MSAVTNDDYSATESVWFLNAALCRVQFRTYFPIRLFGLTRLECDLSRFQSGSVHFD